jgi:hypothetical protein
LIYFGLIDYNSFVHSVSLIEFSDISNENFEHFKETFYSTFLNFKEEFIQQFLSYSSLMENCYSIKHNYLELHLLLILQLILLFLKMLYQLNKPIQVVKIY